MKKNGKLWFLLGIMLSFVGICILVYGADNHNDTVIIIGTFLASFGMLAECFGLIFDEMFGEENSQKTEHELESLQAEVSVKSKSHQNHLWKIDDKLVELEKEIEELKEKNKNDKTRM